MNHNWFEEIEEYLNGYMSDDKRILFESELKMNKDLASLFNVYSIIDKDMGAAAANSAKILREDQEDAEFISTLKKYNKIYFAITEHPDQKYLDALVNNDSLLISEIYKNYAAKVTGWIINNNGEKDNADDVISRALVNLFRRAKTGFVLTVPFESIFFRECKWEWLYELRKRKDDPTRSLKINRLDSEVEIPDRETFPNNNTGADEQQLLDRIFEELPRLNEKCQELIKTHYIGRKKIKELTILLNYKNDNTTAQALFKCLQKLRGLVGPK